MSTTEKGQPSAPDTAIIKAAYATVSTYRQSPVPAREKAFDQWLEQERKKAWEAGYKACKNRQHGQPDLEYPSRRGS